jgi:hypothetical protein
LNAGNKKAPGLKPNKKPGASTQTQTNYIGSDRADGILFKLFLTDETAPENRPFYLAE